MANPHEIWTHGYIAWDPIIELQPSIVDWMRDNDCTFWAGTDSERGITGTDTDTDTETSRDLFLLLTLAIKAVMNPDTVSGVKPETLDSYSFIHTGTQSDLTIM